MALRRTRRKVAAAAVAQAEDSDNDSEMDEHGLQQPNGRHQSDSELPDESSDEPNDQVSDSDERTSQQGQNYGLEQNQYSSYFDVRARKSRTLKSVNTISQLPSVDPPTYRSILADLPTSHETNVKDLEISFDKFHEQWKYCLNNGFNLLFYGYGSKQAVMMRFARSIRSKRKVLIVNGYDPNTTLKIILFSLTQSIRPTPKAYTIPSSPNDLLNFILSAKFQPLTLIIHNLDGTTLRASTTQTSLSQIATHPNIQLVASVDHVHSFLLWDAAITSRFQFLHHNITTFAPYTVELEASSMLYHSYMYGGITLGKRGETGVSGAKYVLASLNFQSRSIFRKMCEYQLSEGGEGATAQIILSEDKLLQMCAEEAVVSDPTVFRRFLNEYIDHNMIYRQKDDSGIDVIGAPYGHDDLGTLVDYIKELDE